MDKKSLVWLHYYWSIVLYLLCTTKPCFTSLHPSLQIQQLQQQQIVIKSDAEMYIYDSDSVWQMQLMIINC